MKKSDRANGNFSMSVEAFEVNALGYLLNPVVLERPAK
jgi:hypothetical protein